MRASTASTTPSPMAEVYDLASSAATSTPKALTVPEGYNIFDIAAAVETAGFAKRDAFLAAERQHTELIDDLLPTSDHPNSLGRLSLPRHLPLPPHATPPRYYPPPFTASARSAPSRASTEMNMAPTVTMASVIEKRSPRTPSALSWPASSSTASPGPYPWRPTPP